MSRDDLWFGVGIAISVILILAGLYCTFMGFKGITKISIGQLTLETSVTGIVLILLGLGYLWIMGGPFRTARDQRAKAGQAIEATLRIIDAERARGGLLTEEDLRRIDAEARELGGLAYYTSRKMEEIFKQVESRTKPTKSGE